MTHGLTPVFRLIALQWIKFQSRTISPMAPADMHLRIATKLADAQRRG